MIMAMKYNRKRDPRQVSSEIYILSRPLAPNRKEHWLAATLHRISLFLKMFILYWTIVDLQCYVSFRCTAK